jgi:hypothetical protein
MAYSWTVAQNSVHTDTLGVETDVIETTFTLLGDDPDNLASLADLITRLEDLSTTYGVTAIDALVSATVVVSLRESP